MLFDDVNLNVFRTTSDLFINLRQLIESRSKERMVCWVYWPEIDYLSHLYGPSDLRPAAEFDNFSLAFDRLLLSQLNPETRGNNLFILTSDHGQVTTTPDPHYDLRNHPSLTRRLHIMPTGENRFIYLYIRPGQTEAVREYIERTWPQQFVTLDPVYAVQTGLFGPGKPHFRLQERLGDLLLVARGRFYLWWGEKENILIGRHGGLSPEEMLVPFLAFHL